MEIIPLLHSIKELIVKIPPIPEYNITGIEMNSRHIDKGYIFTAIPGFTYDGHDYIDDAIQRGAAAIVGEKDLDLSVPYIQVTNSREAVARLAGSFYGHPSKRLKLIGVTGTNGKTTTAYMLKHILNQAGFSCALLGTVSYIINGENVESANTTPDAIQLQKLLAKSKDEYVIMEVSSHALDQRRVEGIEFDFGIFTNLSHDHLDYHHSMENYFSVKASLFLAFLKKGGKAIINHLDEYGARLSKLLQMKQITAFTVGKAAHNDIRIDNVEISEGSCFTLTGGGVQHRVDMTFPGIHNVYNAALAFSTAKLIGIPEEDIIEALESFDGVPGRFEMYSHPAGATFVIDYAHTLDAVEYCLKTAKQLGAKRIAHIYGFRGGRDISKREKIVKKSAEMCNYFILTFDDLDGMKEDVMEKELRQLASQYGGGKGKVIPDRTLAILEAWLDACDGEWVIITGKGPEYYKEIFTMPAHSDKEMIEALLHDPGLPSSDGGNGEFLM
ncbi:UDP-N-acetylmuramoyl-L-alanyl-D-glutamate--2,6-diaminopimelate ligase [Peribacillus cavernae]|uniref:UDP-N-acetylmuramyl-tripeptide synthetase n=1 Tax=Peribacillus cavernae TaxID=1674310 RepID=A0A3S0U3L6_9BACI|nr:UDP-N-acetylmuramoyl-L-alanyl-D-glutamate--2,6-diaminopimelate ligase [Peribacillus cavernae]MDQ0217334.1 UDP-N-acetylmuramoyl-L-alanyl-D-glutamate--2,6-diaminopimelate ligase [Peribacillus cavernae]RUQ30210.1 UDP-N-acetylmuramoyl-L-alanyl-D-glutamate--2,6-diaminopimelate ligase [Peribacillus cavernae]